VLYHMLTGQFPFSAESALEVILAKVDGKYVPPSRLEPAVPRDLEEVLALLLAPHPDDRYQSATDLLDDLEELGLASESLTFLHNPVPAGAAPRGARPLTPTRTGLTTAAEEKQWHVLYRTPEGTWATRPLTTAQVLHALGDP